VVKLLVQLATSPFHPQKLWRIIPCSLEGVKPRSSCNSPRGGLIPASFRPPLEVRGSLGLLMQYDRQSGPLAGDVAAWIAAAGIDSTAVLELPGDVSPRRYARLLGAGGASFILATYPPEVRAGCARFLRSTELLELAGVRVPRVLASDCERGWMLLEDLGETTLAERAERPWRELAGWFAGAARLIERIQGLPAAALSGFNPPLDRGLLEKELAQTWDLFLAPRGLLSDAGLARDLEAAFGTLCRELAAAPAVPCHRDFMARNLMPLAGGEVGVLDHQDLRLGPPAYDIASLLNDTLFPPAELEEALLAGAPGAQPRGAYHLAAAQRTFKAVGTYASFARRGARRHLPLIAPTLARALRHLERLPGTASLARRLAVEWSRELAGWSD
jgi:aminoglycoside/choline kinase family phosphotransferase